MGKTYRLGTRERQCTRLGVFADHGARPDRPTLGNGDRSHQHRVRTHMHIVFNDRFVLVGPVVVGGDAASAIIDSIAQLCVSHVGQVVRFGTHTQR